ncbi:phosphodiesterase [Roseibium limicola]|uniref:Phosphodiesterase n=1 Tax=Roseibium limicola TaxID=2816037 RepID=A0A939ENJ4_9HYPH|nr:phosphodiesterase [Roseibium limicola]MBO0344628.1 phosphodiesterase [Roseibium limicola]
MTLLAQITDLHLRPSGLTCYRVSDTNMRAERAVQALLALSPRPDAVLVSGDLTDKDDPREYAQVRRILGKLPMPVYVIPGNHDGSDTMRRELAEFPCVGASSGSKLYYTAEIGDLRLIALDTHVPGQPHGELGEEQLAWLSDELSASDKPTVVALHHPPIPTGLGHMDRIGLKDTAALQKVLRPHGHIERIVCGHVHRPITASFAGKTLTIAPSTAHQVVLDLDGNGSGYFNFEPAAYYLHAYIDGFGLVTHTAYVENFEGPFPFWADEGVSWPG